mmetsp:Transcript_1798/g.5944  ORF Transcript_1798/g.5944 Transcript_1798/m.5944 type:complete len:257 (+) Transcript_1798:45-815(+)
MKRHVGGPKSRCRCILSCLFIGFIGVGPSVLLEKALHPGKGQGCHADEAADRDAQHGACHLGASHALHRLLQRAEPRRLRPTNLPRLLLDLVRHAHTHHVGGNIPESGRCHRRDAHMNRPIVINCFSGQQHDRVVRESKPNKGQPRRQHHPGQLAPRGRVLCMTIVPLEHPLVCECVGNLSSRQVLALVFRLDRLYDLINVFPVADLHVGLAGRALHGQQQMNPVEFRNRLEDGGCRLLGLPFERLLDHLRDIFCL